MRLNKNTYPAYINLESGNYESMKIDQMFAGLFESTGADGFLNFQQSVILAFKKAKNKYYLTEPFKDAIRTATPKIMDGNKHLNEITDDVGIIFTEKGFSIYVVSKNSKYKLLVFGFTREVLTTYGFIDQEDNFGGLACTVEDGKPYNDTSQLVMYMTTLLTGLYFINNCEIEQKVLAPNKKEKSSNGDKHFNESKSDIIILDCRWFTELIRTTPFSVRGHFRWQVHGEGRQKRKLIYIEEFEKEGYKRKPVKQQ